MIFLQTVENFNLGIGIFDLAVEFFADLIVHSQNGKRFDIVGSVFQNFMIVDISIYKIVFLCVYIGNNLEYFHAVVDVTHLFVDKSLTLEEIDVFGFFCDKFFQKNHDAFILTHFDSRLDQLSQNLDSLDGGPLPDDVLGAFEQAWGLTADDAPEYFRYYERPKGVDA